MGIPLSGDILIEIWHETSFYRTEEMLRLEFHTDMITELETEFRRSQLDHACEDKR